jgi:DNA-directed RNA polymerase specialized sigma24 family protein
MVFSDSGSGKNLGTHRPGSSEPKQANVIQCSSEIALHENTKQIMQETPNKLLAYTTAKLHQFKLHSTYQGFDIISEAYSRALQKIRRGENIPNLYGWYTLTSLNIVREYRRIEEKERKIKEIMRVHFSEVCDATDTDKTKHSMESIKRMVNNKLNYKILCLREVDGKSWEEVCHILIEDGDFNCELSKQFIDRTKQRFYRSLRKIHKPKE